VRELIEVKQNRLVQKPGFREPELINSEPFQERHVSITGHQPSPCSERSRQAEFKQPCQPAPPLSENLRDFPQDAKTASRSYSVGEQSAKGMAEHCFPERFFPCGPFA